METKIIERRIVKQDWYETELTKTGWDSNGWYFADDGQDKYLSWVIVQHLKSDKFGNPILGVAEKETTLTS